MMGAEHSVERLRVRADRLDALAKSVVECAWSDFSMRVPAEPERDADLVLSSSAIELRAYADLREQIERAREGVTDEVVHVACAVYFGDLWPDDVEDIELCRVFMRKALLTVAHLLPSAPAQAAQVDLQKVFDALHRSAPIPEIIRHVPGAEQLHHEAHAMVREALATAPTAKPVAQGEAAFSEPEIHAVVMAAVIAENMAEAAETPEDRYGGLMHAEQAELLRVIAARMQSAQPRAVPEGHVLVPREPTQDMLEAGAVWMNSDDKWSAMINATPSQEPQS